VFVHSKAVVAPRRNSAERGVLQDPLQQKSRSDSKQAAHVLQLAALDRSNLKQRLKVR